jgi:heptosyltransferase II
MSAAPPSSLMVRLPNPLGDAVMALPLISNLSRIFCNCRITLVGNPAYESLFGSLKHVHNYVALDNNASITEQANVLREHDCDTIILCPNSWSSALVAFKAGIKQRIGRRHHLRSMLLTHSLPAISNPKLMTELYGELCEAFGEKRKVDPVYLPTPDISVSWAPSDLGYYMVAPGAAFGTSKQYPAHLMAEVMNGIYQKHKLLPVLFGAPAEHDALVDLSKRLNHPYIMAKQNSTLGEVSCVMSKARFLLCMDSGARHLATAIGIPQLAIFGPTDPKWTAHAMDAAIFVANGKLNCLGCHKKVCPIKGHPCMNELEPKLIVDEAARLVG